jgi:hypothetical protein
MTAAGILLIAVGLGMLFGRTRYLQKRKRGEAPPDEKTRSFFRKVAPGTVASDEYYDRLMRSFMWIPAVLSIIIGIVTLIEG